jgi:hypothetical protein
MMSFTNSSLPRYRFFQVWTLKQSTTYFFLTISPSKMSMFSSWCGYFRVIDLEYDQEPVQVIRIGSNSIIRRLELMRRCPFGSRLSTTIYLPRTLANRGLISIDRRGQGTKGPAEFWWRRQLQVTVIFSPIQSSLRIRTSITGTGSYEEASVFFV